LLSTRHQGQTHDDSINVCKTRKLNTWVARVTRSRVIPLYPIGKVRPIPVLWLHPTVPSFRVGRSRAAEIAPAMLSRLVVKATQRRDHAKEESKQVKRSVNAAKQELKGMAAKRLRRLDAAFNIFCLSAPSCKEAVAFLRRPRNSHFFQIPIPS
jgi:hypothetical protein